MSSCPSFATPAIRYPSRPRSVVVLSFFGLDCVPCRKDLPDFKAVAAHCREQLEGVTCFLVSTDPLRRKQELKAFIEEQGIPCDVLLAPYTNAYAGLGVQSIPHTLVIARDGTVAHEIKGAVTDYRQRLTRAIKETLQ